MILIAALGWHTLTWHAAQEIELRYIWTYHGEQRGYIWYSYIWDDEWNYEESHAVAQQNR